MGEWMRMSETATGPIPELLVLLYCEPPAAARTVVGFSELPLIHGGAQLLDGRQVTLQRRDDRLQVRRVQRAPRAFIQLDQRARHRLCGRPCARFGLLEGREVPSQVPSRARERSERR